MSQLKFTFFEQAIKAGQRYVHTQVEMQVLSDAAVPPYVPRIHWKC
jgi:hypothetical protein